MCEVRGGYDVISPNIFLLLTTTSGLFSDIPNFPPIKSYRVALPLNDDHYRPPSVHEGLLFTEKKTSIHLQIEVP